MNQTTNEIIHDTIDKLIDNISFLKNKQREKINLILDSGLFNGSYLIGSLYFLKQLEKKQYVKIDKISGCSIGSIVAVLYYADLLDSFNDIYTIGVDELIKNNIFNINIIINLLKEKLPNNICNIVNKKLYICYYDLKKRKKIVRSKYKNMDDIIETIKRSCCFPLLLNNNVTE
jgi:predicted acylesterase/phospholipase RssA